MVRFFTLALERHRFGMAAQAAPHSCPHLWGLGKEDGWRRKWGRDEVGQLRPWTRMSGKWARRFSY
eukprot:8296108-Pyramimonas_sp.AAC.1